MYRTNIKQIILVLVALFVLPASSARADDFMSLGVSPKELQANLGTPQAPLIVDLRKPPEFGIGHIPGAVNIPLDELPERLDAVRHANGVLIYCINGSRTRQAEPLLYNHGITRVYHLEGAFQAWIKDSHPIEKGGAGKTGW